MTILVYDLENNLLENESLGSLYPNREENNSNFRSFNSRDNADNNNYENPKIYYSEVNKEKKYNENDEEKVESSNKSGKIRKSSDRDDDNGNNYELNISLIEKLINSQNQKEDNNNSNKKKCQ